MEGTKCRYVNCVEGQEKERILHELPVCDVALSVRWLVNSGNESLVTKDLAVLRSTRFFICSDHFSEDSYLAKGTLKENAVPLPYWRSLGRAQSKLTEKEELSKKKQQNSKIEEPPQIPENTDSWDQLCRTCASKKTNLLEMNRKNGGKNTDMSLLSKLRLLIEIEEEDVLPLKMCCECATKLEQSFRFFQQIYVADNTLRRVFARCRFEEAERRENYEEEIKVSRKDSTPAPVEQEESLVDVYTLLTDNCRSDEELDWSDVLKIMKDTKAEVPCRKKKQPETHVSSSKIKYECNECQKSFRKKRAIRLHIISAHMPKTPRAESRRAKIIREAAKREMNERKTLERRKRTSRFSSLQETSPSAERTKRSRTSL